MQLIYLTLDGLSDTTYKELDGKSPLEYANTPNMDFLAKQGSMGWMYTIREDIAPESDQAMLSLMGYDPFLHYTGRGVLEALGCDQKIDMAAGDLILRCNFAKEEEDNSERYLQDVEADISDEEADRLAEKLNEIELDQGQAHFYHTVGYRGVLVIKAPNDLDYLSSRISNSHPSYELVEDHITTALPRPEDKQIKAKEVKPLESNKRSIRTANIVNQYLEKAREILEKKEKVDCILTRGASTDIPDIDYLIHRWALIADMPVEKALGSLMGMEPIAKGENYQQTADKILQLEDYDACYLQLKGPDAAGHRGQAKAKAEAIEKIDREFVKKLREAYEENEEFNICITADHSTECSKRAHTELPVPLLLCGPEIAMDQVEEFSERVMKQGGLGLFESGTELFNKLVQFLGEKDGELP